MGFEKNTESFPFHNSLVFLYLYTKLNLCSEKKIWFEYNEANPDLRNIRADISQGNLMPSDLLYTNDVPKTLNSRNAAFTDDSALLLTGQLGHNKTTRSNQWCRHLDGYIAHKA